MISYYDLLTMIKAGNIPEKVKYKNKIYSWQKGYYYNCDIGSYLTDDLSEEDMLEKNIEIIKLKKIEKLNIEDFNSVKINDEERVYCDLPPDEIRLINKINEIIEVINEEKEIQDNQE